MGTVVLLPRDVHHVDRDAPASSSSSNNVPIHATNDYASRHATNHHASNALIRRGNEGKRPKMKNLYKVVKNSPPKSNDVQTLTILQRPKLPDAVDFQMISKFMVKTDSADASSTSNGVKKSDPSLCNEKEETRILDGSKKGYGKAHPPKIAIEMEKDGIKAKKVILDVKTDKSKPSKISHNSIPKFQKDSMLNSGKSDNSKTNFNVLENPENLPISKNTLNFVEKNHQNTSQNLHLAKTASKVVLKSQQNAPGNLVKLRGNVSTPSTEVKLEQEISNKKVKDVDLTYDFLSYPHMVGVGLRRASTDPQSIQRLAREMTKISCNTEANNYEPSSHSTKNDLVTNYESYNEKWAGPAYSSSPAPSALPLPKFTMSNMRLPLPSMKASYDFRDSRIIPKMPVEQSNTSYGVGPSICSASVGAYDVVLATKSLRKMLNLDL